MDGKEIVTRGTFTGSIKELHLVRMFTKHTEEREVGKQGETTWF